MNRRAFLTTGVATGVAATASAALGAEYCTNSNKAVARRFTEDLWGRHRVDLVDELLTEDFVNHNPFPETEGNREGERKAVTLHSAVMGDPNGKVEDQVAEGDKVATRWSFAGTHKGEFLGIAPTGKRVHITGINICRFKNGRIVELWRQVDVVGAIAQLRAEKRD